MKRSLSLAALAVASVSLALAPPASAQFGRGMMGANRSNNLDIQQQRNAQMSRQKRYSGPPKSKTASKPPGLNLGTPDASGRSDLSGRRPSGYAAIRDPIAKSGSSRRPGPPPAPAFRPLQAPRVAGPARVAPPALSTIPRATRIPPPPPIVPR